MSEAKKSNFKLLSDSEREVCGRLADRRRASRMTQDEFAAAILLTRAQLTNIESMRVPLRFWPGWRACKKLNINQRWLSTGELPSSPFFDLDLKEHQLNIAETALFSVVCRGRLHTDLELRSELAWSIGQYQSSGDAMTHDYGETLIEIVKVFLSKIPEAERAGALATLRGQMVAGAASDKIVSLAQLKVIRQRHAQAVGKNTTPAGVQFANDKIDVDALVTLGESVSVKAQWPGLLERLKKATKARGVASALARELDVPLASVSRWLNGKREPSGDITLKLLRWVERQEAK